MPLSLTSKTYPVGKDAPVSCLIPDGANGFIGLTTLDADTVLNDPANHVYTDPANVVRASQNDPGNTLVAFLFSDDGGKTYKALPILIRIPGSDPAFPYGLPVAGLGNKYDGGIPPQQIDYQQKELAYFFNAKALGLNAFSLVRDPQSGAPVFFGQPTNNGIYQDDMYRWTAQGSGRRGEDWVTTRPDVGTKPFLPWQIRGVQQRFFGDMNVNFNPPKFLGPKDTDGYPIVAFAGSPGLVFGGGKKVYWWTHQGHFAFTPISVFSGIDTTNPFVNNPFLPLGGGDVAGNVISPQVQPVAQHPHQPQHLLRGTPAGSAGLAQSFDGGQTTSRRYYSITGPGEPFTFTPPGDLFPLNASAFFVEDAIYCFGAWGFSVSRDGGQSWGWETIGGVQYAFNLLHAKGGGYYPDSALLGTNPLQPYAFPVINVATFPNTTQTRYLIARNSAPDPAAPGGRVNGVQQFQGALDPTNPFGGTATFTQQQFTQTAHFQGMFWHAVCLLSNSRGGDTGPQVPRWILLRSPDLGATWEQMPEPPPVPYGLPLVADTRTGWLHWGLQYTSRDAGQTWITN